MKMTNCFRELIHYFGNVLHPASGWAERKQEKKTKKTQRSSSFTSTQTPECYNMRSVAKRLDKMRPNPAP